RSCDLQRQEMGSVLAADSTTVQKLQIRVICQSRGFEALARAPPCHTLEEVGQKFGVTRERIRQIEAKALRKLRHPSRSRRLRAFLGDVQTDGETLFGGR